MINTQQPTLRVYEIYDSLQGESTLAGMPCTFVRLAGCPLRCHYCDTPDALPARSGKLLTIDAICDQVRALAQPLVLVTGGEPLAQPNAIPLLSALITTGSKVQLETSGALDISAVPESVMRVVDIKTPDSGEVAHNRWQNLALLHPGDEIKFVICSESDYRWSIDTIAQFDLLQRNIPLLISPAHDQVTLQQLAEWLRRDQLPIRLQPQLHKWIWGPDATGV
ncbi:MAG: radical SAM protein [Mariprofundales bacterium]|nr:radical SAM protein [Mariprofundales bacterium]